MEPHKSDASTGGKIADDQAAEAADRFDDPTEGDDELVAAAATTFRTIATVMDFTVNYVVVRDVATAVGLSAFAFVVGPFVYLGHEKLWDYYGSRRERVIDSPTPTNLLPARA